MVRRTTVVRKLEPVFVVQRDMRNALRRPFSRRLVLVRGCLTGTLVRDHMVRDVYVIISVERILALVEAVVKLG